MLALVADTLPTHTTILSTLSTALAFRELSENATRLPKEKDSLFQGQKDEYTEDCAQ